MKVSISARAVCIVFAAAAIAASSLPEALAGNLSTTTKSADYVRSDAKTAQDIERLIGTIVAAKKPLPVWVVDISMRAYQTYKTYKAGRRIEAIEAEVLALLKVIAEMRADAEAGREMSQREYRRTVELLHAHLRRIDDLASRVGDLEQRVYRPGCGKLHAWRGGRCVNVAEHPR